MSMAASIQVENRTMLTEMRLKKNQMSPRAFVMQQEDLYYNGDNPGQMSFVNKIKVEDSMYTAITELTEYHDIELMEEKLIKPESVSDYSNTFMNVFTYEQF